MNNSITTNSTSINNSVISNGLNSNSYIEIPLLTRQNGCSDLFKLLNNDEADKNISRQYSSDSNDSNDSHSSNNLDYDKSNFDNFKASPLFILPPSIIDTDENYLYFNNIQNNGTVLRSPAECNKFTNDELNYINEMQIDQYSAFLN